MTLRQWFWALVHRVLPYSVLRHVCELCDEFGFDPRDEGIWDRKIASGEWTPVQVTGPPVQTWGCQHATFTGSFVGPPSFGMCDCELRRIPQTLTA